MLLIDGTYGFPEAGLSANGARGSVPSPPLTLLFHCDESYDARIHMHLGILSTGEQAAAVEQDVRQLLSWLNWEVLKGSVKELHGQPLFHGEDGWGGVDVELRIEVYRRTLSLLGAHDLEVMYRGIDMVGYQRKYKASFDPRADAFRFMFGDLLEKHLHRRCRVRGEYALVITDHQDQYAHELRYAHEVTQAALRHASKKSGIIDTCHFVDSEHSPLVQLADMAAFVMRRRASNPVEHDPRLELVMEELAGVVLEAVPAPRWAHCSVHRLFT